MHPDAYCVEFLCHPGTVCIDGLAYQEFIANGDDGAICLPRVHASKFFH
jgi:hypothetical protein